MVFQPYSNASPSPAPSKRLAPTLANSYQMFFQQVTHYPSKSNKLSVELHLLPLPCYYGERGWGLGVLLPPPNLHKNNLLNLKNLKNFTNIRQYTPSIPPSKPPFVFAAFAEFAAFSAFAPLPVLWAIGGMSLRR